MAEAQQEKAELPFDRKKVSAGTCITGMMLPMPT
jgi:hypothetical protein